MSFTSNTSDIVKEGSKGFAGIVSKQTYESMFPNRNGLYSYDSLVKAIEKYPNFCNEGSDVQRKREAAAFLANIAHETTGGWDAAPGGRYAWGLHFIEEQKPPNQYCDSSNSTYPCAAGKSYQPSLKHQDYSLTRIVYDREERSRLAIEQGQFVENNFIKPYQTILEQWSANYAL